jgi:hypothetical protein
MMDRREYVEDNRYWAMSIHEKNALTSLCMAGEQTMLGTHLKHGNNTQQQCAPQRSHNNAVLA